MTVAATVEGCGTGWPSEIPASAGANLMGADLTGANLTGVNLIRADHIRTDLTHANLTGANLTHANLTGAKLADTNWPDDMQVPEGWERVQARRFSPRHGRSSFGLSPNLTRKWTSAGHAAADPEYHGLARVCRGVMGQAAWLFPVPPGSGSVTRQGLTSKPWAPSRPGMINVRSRPGRRCPERAQGNPGPA